MQTFAGELQIETERRCLVRSVQRGLDTSKPLPTAGDAREGPLMRTVWDARSLCDMWGLRKKEN